MKCGGGPAQPTYTTIPSHSIVAGHMIKKLSCDNDVGDVGEVEQEERVDKTLDNEHEVLSIILNFLPFFMRCGN